MNEKDLINLLKNILPVASNLSIIISTGTLIHTISKDTKEINRNKASVTIDINKNFLENTMPLIETYENKISKKIQNNLAEKAKSEQISKTKIIKNKQIYKQIKLDSSIDLNINQILNDLETIAQYSLYKIVNNKLFYNSTYNKIIKFYAKNKYIIKEVNKQKHDYDNLEKLYKMKLIYAIKWHKWYNIKYISKKSFNKIKELI